MRRHDFLQPSKELAAHEHRRERRRRGGISSVIHAENPGQFVLYISLVFVDDVDNRGVDTVAMQQELHHVAHAASFPRKHHHRILRN